MECFVFSVQILTVLTKPDDNGRPGNTKVQTLLSSSIRSFGSRAQEYALPGADIAVSQLAEETSMENLVATHLAMPAGAGHLLHHETLTVLELLLILCGERIIW